MLRIRRSVKLGSRKVDAENGAARRRVQIAQQERSEPGRRGPCDAKGGTQSERRRIAKEKRGAVK